RAGSRPGRSRIRATANALAGVREDAIRAAVLAYITGADVLLRDRKSSFAAIRVSVGIGRTFGQVGTMPVIARLSIPEFPLVPADDLTVFPSALRKTILPVTPCPQCHPPGGYGTFQQQAAERYGTEEQYQPPGLRQPQGGDQQQDGNGELRRKLRC